MEAFLYYSIIAATPLFFATLGELLAEKSGSLNLGVEGLMLLGALMGFIGAYSFSSAGMSLLFAFGAGALGALIFAFLTVSLRANQVVVGLTLTIFGTGFSSFVGTQYIGMSVPASVRSFFANIDIPLLHKIPYIGHILFEHDILVYLSFVLIPLVWFYLSKTRPGLNMRAVGENAAAADASGVRVSLHRYIHVIVGGGLCGLGGGYLAVVYVPIYQADVVTGRGWIAVALVIFASWKPGRAYLSAFIFGALSILGIYLQGWGVHVSQYIFDMVPYLATIVIVVASSVMNRKEGQPPRDLSVSYFREAR